MPPPPAPVPNFVPDRRRQRLDVTRHLKSRELWNQVRFHASASSSRLLWARALFHAIAYELQPFRVQPFLRRVRQLLCEEGGLPRLASRLAASFLTALNSALSFVSGLWDILRPRLRRASFRSVRSYLRDHRSLLLRSGACLLLLRFWYRAVVYLHDLLHAGPLVVILTLLALLCTVGLGDGTGAAATGIPSAYSVFNRGVRRILGDMDAEELARQYAGGALMARGGMMARAEQHRDDANRRHRDNFDDGNGVPDNGVLFRRNDHQQEEEREREEEPPLVNEQRRRRRLERLEQRQQRQPAGEALRGGDGDNRDNEDDNDHDDSAAPTQDEGTAAAAAAVGRKSGKKARRRDLERRREMQRLRQAAAALGFVGGEGDVHDEREREARMALVE